MKERTILIEAASLAEARSNLYTHELIVLEESILCQGKLETIEAIAETVEEAFRKAQSKVPPAASIEKRETRLSPERIELLVQAHDEESAGKGKAAVIASVSLFKKGRRGFLGFGKTSNVYEVVVSQPAVVELTFREPAKIRAKVRDYFAEDLVESIQAARESSPQWPDILELLNPKSDSEIQAWLVNLHELSPTTVLDTIEIACQNNQKANWHIIIKEAHTQASIARARELREQEIRLRDLDVTTADTFGLYTYVDWHAKSHREPTGFPRWGSEYDHHRHPDKPLRRTIPRYSTDREAFKEVERGIRRENLYEPYLQVLLEQGQNETTATPEQKCIAALKARSNKKGSREQ